MSWGQRWYCAGVVKRRAGVAVAVAVAVAVHIMQCRKAEGVLFVQVPVYSCRIVCGSVVTVALVGPTLFSRLRSPLPLGVLQ